MIYTECVILHTVSNFTSDVLFYTQCVVLHIVCSFTHCVYFYTQCVIVHTMLFYREAIFVRHANQPSWIATTATVSIQIKAAWDSHITLEHNHVPRRAFV